jgi:acetylornithine/succinyldiaminopimelate/putrescine aminotransferase
MQTTMTRVFSRADNGMAVAWLNLSVMQGDEVQKQVAEVAKALYQRTDELAVLLARAITRVRGRRR